MMHGGVLRATALVVLLHGARLAAEEPPIDTQSTLLQAGAAAIDITPTQFPVIVNGMFEERTADRAFDKLHSRALVFDDGLERIAIVVVDSCGLPRSVCDEAKKLAAERVKIRPDRICISATHTHSAPSAWPALGSDADAAYVQFLIPQIARSIEEAVKRLQPAEIGFSVVRDEEHTFCRRWIRRPDRLLTDPFGQQNVRANMHPGHQSPDVIGPAGPTDPDISILSIRSLEHEPIAVLANYSMHYFGSQPVSADYFGRFAEALEKQMGQRDVDGKFVVIMSQGTSGDQMWMDYGKPQAKISMDEYATAIADKVQEAVRKINYVQLGGGEKPFNALEMKETTLKLNRRVPDELRLAWARPIVEKLAGRKPTTQQEIYAREQLLLAANPTAELKLQAIRIGDVCMTAIPNEVFAVTGLKLKQQSPFENTFNITLANGCEGYIPPAEQHVLGGYTTWAARSAGMEVDAERRIVDGLLDSLADITGDARRVQSTQRTRYSAALEATKPEAYWRLEETSGFTARDTTENERHGTLEGPMAFGLPGSLLTPESPAQFRRPPNRAFHFCGGRLRSAALGGEKTYSVEMLFWNGLPHDARPVTGYLFSRGTNGDPQTGDHLGIGGTHAGAGRLIFFNGNRQNQLLIGTTPLKPKQWYHVALVRDGKNVEVYLNQRLEISGLAEATAADDAELFFGGRCDDFANFEGKLDEIAIYDRKIGLRSLKDTTIETAQPDSLRGDAAGDLAPTDANVTIALMETVSPFRIDLVAAEPLVLDPVAIDWGPDGKLWVAEMADYPYGSDGKMKPCGRIRYLQDTNGDGRYDKSTIFLEDVSFPNGVMASRDGVLITAAPQVIFAKDTDGDGRADKQEVLYDGFNPGNPQLRVNGLQWGLDGWIYLANGLSGGTVKSLKTGKTVEIGGRDVRIHPETGDIDTVAGQSEFGRNRDDNGHWYGSDNSNPLWHFVLEERYARRNPHFAPPDLRRQLMTPANPPVFAISQLQKRFFTVNHDERFTSACSAIVYRDDLLFPGDRERGIQHAFVCEPVHNLIQHRVLKADGTSFAATRTEDEQDRDFLASTDNWFRPVMVRTGPDGALWVVDMYRYMIEHPDWLPEEGKKFYEPHFRLGEDRGRIYRLLPNNAPPLPPLRIDLLKGPELVELLENRNGTVRDLAQRQIVDRGIATAAPRLRAKWQASRKGVTRLYAMTTLNLLGVLESRDVLRGLEDADGAVVRHALQLAERFTDNAEICAATCNLLIDSDAQTRLQLACTLGFFDDEHAAKTLAHIARRSGGDVHLHAAAMSSLNDRNLDTVLKAVLQGDKTDAALIADLLRQAIAFKHDRAVLELAALDDPATVATLLAAYAKRGAPLAEAWQAHGESGAKAIERVQAICEQSRALLAEDSAPLARRLSAITLLGFEPKRQAEDLTLLHSLLALNVPVELQIASLERLAEIGSVGSAAALLDAWKSFTPTARARAVAVLLSRTEWIKLWFDRLESGDLTAADLDATTRERLLQHPDGDLRARAGKLFAGSTGADRAQAIDALRPAVTLKGDAPRGATIFKTKCASCHKLEGVGNVVGPNLAALTDKSPLGLLTAILDPSRAVEAKYVNYLAATDDGRTYSGILASESGTSITLLAGDGKPHTLLRSELEALTSTGRSLMPDGFEKELPAQDLADLIAHLIFAKQ